MFRIGKDIFSRRHLHELADVHYGDAIANVLDDAQVVGDEQIGKAKLLLEVEHEVKHLRLN